MTTTDSKFNTWSPLPWISKIQIASVLVTLI